MKECRSRSIQCYSWFRSATALCLSSFLVIVFIKICLARSSASIIAVAVRVDPCGGGPRGLVFLRIEGPVRVGESSMDATRFNHVHMGLKIAKLNHLLTDLTLGGRTVAGSEAIGWGQGWYEVFEIFMALTTAGGHSTRTSMCGPQCPRGVGCYSRQITRGACALYDRGGI